MAVFFLFSELSCTKDIAGKEIRFDAATRPDAPLTKTSYSGDTFTDGDITYERINWENGDVIRLYSDEAQTAGGEKWADYTIVGSSIAIDGRYSTSKLSGVGLLWGEGLGEYHFWGIYPPHAMGSAGTFSSLTIPDAQNVKDENKTETTDCTAYAPDMGSAWMLADLADVPEGADGLSLDFYPAFTAFQFTLASQFATEIKVKSFTLSSEDTDIAGSFDASLAAAGASTYDNFTLGSRSITVSFGAGVDITQAKSLQFTVLALPRTISKLSISFEILVHGADITRTLALKQMTPTPEFISFAACRKHEIKGLVLPSGDLQFSINVNDWTDGPDPYEYISPVASSLKCLEGESYRRYDTDSDYSDWEGSHIVVSYGYKNPNDEIIITDNPTGFQEKENTLLRPAFAPILELATNSDPSQVLKLQLDNPRFKFIQYGNLGGSPSGGIDLNVRDHSKSDHLDIVSGSGVKTFFSVVPVNQFSIDAAVEEKTCRVSLLSVSPGTLHEIPFNMTSDATPVQALPGENIDELKFMYFGPAVYGTTGNLVP